MTDGVADQLVASALDNEQQLTALKKKYHAQFKAALGAKTSRTVAAGGDHCGNVGDAPTIVGGAAPAIAALIYRLA